MIYITARFHGGGPFACPVGGWTMQRWSGLGRTMDLIGRWARDRRGNVAMILALGLPILVVLGGAAVDMNRQITARNHAQGAADAAALSASSSRQLDRSRLHDVATDYLDANLNLDLLQGAPDIEVGLETDTRVRIDLAGSVNTVFLGLIGINQLPVKVTSTAERGTVEEIELVLVLDNTWSMEATDEFGVKRINALKSAAGSLVDGLLETEDGTVRIGVVPYADYVTVGTQYRGASWLDVPADRTIQHAAGSWTEQTRRECTYGPWKRCTRYVDGLAETYDCRDEVCRDVPLEQPRVHSYPARTSYERWYGCVGSPRNGNARLSDNPSSKYPGFLSDQDRCPRPLTRLTERRATVIAALNGMVTQTGGHRPRTYIPGGLLWAINVLSPTHPFDDGQVYDPDNRNPRKIMVLMTDGENTMRYNPSNGRHENNDHPPHLAQTDRDTAALCTYAKGLNIEVYTVAMAVDDADAVKMLRDCATDAEKAFEARDSAGLAGAFADIGASIYRVRLVD